VKCINQHCQFNRHPLSLSLSVFSSVIVLQQNTMSLQSLWYQKETTNSVTAISVSVKAPLTRHQCIKAKFVSVQK